MEAVGAGHRAQQLLPSWRSAIATRSLPTEGAKPSRVAGTYWLAPPRCPAVRGSALHPQRPVRRLPSARSAGAGSRAARRASTKRGRRPAACQQARQGLRIVKSPRSRGRMPGRQRRAYHQVDTGQPAVGVQRGRQRLAGRS